jgi:hypothetical protein
MRRNATKLRHQNAHLGDLADATKVTCEESRVGANAFSKLLSHLYIYIYKRG